MSIDTPELTRLETLPTEILNAVVNHLSLWEIKYTYYYTNIFHRLDIKQSTQRRVEASLVTLLPS